MSKLVPSPDWFVGLDSLNLCKNGRFVDSVQIEVSNLCLKSLNINWQKSCPFLITDSLLFLILGWSNRRRYWQWIHVYVAKLANCPKSSNFSYYKCIPISSSRFFLVSRRRYASEYCDVHIFKGTFHYESVVLK